MSAPRENDQHADQLKTEELTGIIREIQQRVRSRYPSGTQAAGAITIPDLMPLVHARDTAEAKVAAIGTVNPRPPGLIHSIVQAGKKAVSRALDWHVREQVEFNRAAMACTQAVLEALTEVNRALSLLGAELASQAQKARELSDTAQHWTQWRAGWEERSSRTEVYLLRTISELHAAFQNRATSAENDFRQTMREQHASFERALQTASQQIQERLWSDLARVRCEYEKLIHDELRIIRQRASTSPAVASVAPAPSPADEPAVDWLRFAERFRGSEDRVRRLQAIYAERFAGASDVLDIGCGRGEFLEMAREAGVSARGIDANPENVAWCREKGLDAETADIFSYLNLQADGSLGGIFCSQVIEHLQPARVADLVKLLGAKVRRNGLVVVETPNPECLAIFATHFYLDPTHTRPTPAALLSFYLEEAGFGKIEIRYLSPAVESVPALADIPERFRETFFGGLDYAVFARKL